MSTARSKSSVAPLAKDWEFSKSAGVTGLPLLDELLVLEALFDAAPPSPPPDEDELDEDDAPPPPLAV
jgi:hypothetical protein